jgi:hypothetical protein
MGGDFHRAVGRHESSDALKPCTRSDECCEGALKVRRRSDE